jgi:hypothetical protein
MIVTIKTIPIAMSMFSIGGLYPIYYALVKLGKWGEVKIEASPQDYLIRDNEQSAS